MRRTSQTKNPLIVILALSSLLFTIVECLPYNDRMNVNIYFSYAGKYTIEPNDLAFSNPSQYTFSYPNNLYYYDCVISLGGLIMQAANYSMDVIVGAASCSYSLSFSVRTGNLNSISKLSVSHFSYYDWRLNGNLFRYYNSSINRNISKDPSTTTVIVQVNYDYLSYQYYYVDGYGWVYETNSNIFRAMVFLNGFKMSSNSSSLTYSVSLTAELLPSNGDSKTVKVYVGSLSQVPTYVQAIAFTVFIHQSPNSGNQYDRNVRIYSQSFGGSNSFQYSNDKHIMMDFNTFVGLTSFFVSNQNQLSFQSSIVDKSIISVVSPNYLSVTFIIAYSQWCSWNYNYYFYQRCFVDSCPSWSYQMGIYCACRYSSNVCFEQSQRELQQQKQSNISKYWTFLYSIITFALAALVIYVSLTKLKGKNKNNQLAKIEKQKFYVENQNPTPKQLQSMAKQFAVEV